MLTTVGCSFAAMIAREERSTTGALPLTDTGVWRDEFSFSEAPTRPPTPPAAPASKSAATPPTAHLRHVGAVRPAGWPPTGGGKAPGTGGQAPGRGGAPGEGPA